MFSGSQMLLTFKVTKASKEKRENEEKVGSISSRELNPELQLGRPEPYYYLDLVKRMTIF